MADGFSFVYSVVLTAGVFAALISSIANIIISIMNNYRLKDIEKIKQANEIDKYRYSKLYELRQKWEDYDLDTSKEVDESDDEWVSLYADVLGSIYSNLKRYWILKPLLDEKYIDKLDEISAEVHRLGNQIVLDHDTMEKEEYHNMKWKQIDLGTTFSKILKESIDEQLRDLMRKA